MQRLLCVLLLVIVISFCAACSREWRDPDTALPSQSVSIAIILASPDAYDMSGVIVIGKIWRPRVESMGVNANGVEEDLYSRSRLPTGRVIGIDVYINGKAPVTEGEYIRVVGLFREEFPDSRGNISITGSKRCVWKAGVRT